MLLAGDIGGTKTALAVYSADRGPREPLAERIFPSAEYPSLEAIAREYNAEVDLPVTQACFAVAGPVSNGRATLTNLPWVVEESALKVALGLESARVLNDVQAMATAVPGLMTAEEFFAWVQRPENRDRFPGFALPGRRVLRLAGPAAGELIGSLPRDFHWDGNLSLYKGSSDEHSR